MVARENFRTRVSAEALDFGSRPPLWDVHIRAPGLDCEGSESETLFEF